MSTSNLSTLTIPSSFDPVADSQALNQAIKNKEGAEVIASIIINRSIQQRSQLKSTYEYTYHEDLIPLISKDKEVENLMNVLFYGYTSAAAKSLHKKVTKEEIDEIICCMSPSELMELKRAYDITLRNVSDKKEKSKSLEDSISDCTKGAHKDLILGLFSGDRDEITTAKIYDFYCENQSIDGLIKANDVISDVIQIHEASDKNKQNETALVNIIGKRNDLHLKACYETYRNNVGSTLVEQISKHIKQPLKNSLNTIIMNAVDKRLLLVSQLYSALKGAGTKEATLSRILGSRAEIDLQLLKFLYEERIGKSLGEAIYSETSGDLRIYFMSLLNISSKK